MGRTTKPRKRYRPIVVERDPLEAAAALAALLPAATRDRETTKLRGAFTRLREGPCDWGAWCALADYLNVGAVLAELRICNDRAADIAAAQQALSSVHARHADRGRLVLTGPEIATLELGVDVAAIQLRYCTQGELQRAITTARHRIAQAQAGNAARGVKVLNGGAHMQPAGATFA